MSQIKNLSQVQKAVQELFKKAKGIDRIIAIHGPVLDKDISSQLHSTFDWILDLDAFDFMCMIIRVLREKPGLLKVILARK